ncbi:heparan-alpha-glucosaminide N-acetyltransferase domain-containing protein [Litoribacillus peritrichatus]|uniref:Heparan-alpha-glucosaminide N-acetyltransferase catalytic domain-containing protein n=1 Tax=Litoribacillus peritrichatus TaxID=718191 RepID=A0ABP7MBE8_9GAMM
MTNSIPALNPATQAPLRINTFDLARGLAVIFMIMIHVLNFYGTSEVQSGTFGTTLQTLVDWPSASVFVFIMGILIPLSGKNSLSVGLYRAVKLFALGYLLNLTRSSIPMWLSIQMGLVSYEDLGGYTPTSEFFVGDIFQFAGLTYAVCTLLRYYISDVRIWLATAAAVIFVSPLVWDTSAHWGASNEFFKLLWGDQSQGAVFPLFPWLAYCIGGMVLGQWFKETDNHPQFFKKTLFAGLTLITFGSALLFSNPEFHAPHHLRGGPGLITTITGFVLVWLCFCRQLVERIKPNRAFELFYLWGKNVTPIYIIHWLIIGWGHMLVGSQTLETGSTLFSMALIILMSHLILKIWLKISSKNTTDEPTSTAQPAT